MMVTQVHCNSSKSIMTVVQPILNYSKSVSGCRWCTIQLRFQRYQPEQEIIQIASLRGFQTMMVTQVQCKSSKSKNDCCKTNTQLFQECGVVQMV